MSKKIAAIVGIVVTVVVIGIVIAYFVATSKPAKTTIAGAVSTYPELRLVWKSQPLISKSDLIRMGLYDRVYSWWDYLQAPVLVSPDGKYVVVLAQNYKVYIFDAKSGTILKTLEYGAGEVPVTVAFSPDGRYLVVGVSSRFGEVKVYHVGDWKLVLDVKLAKFVKGPSNATPSTIFRRPWLGVEPRYITFSKDGKVMYISVVEREVNPKTQIYVIRRIEVDLTKIYPEIARKYKSYVISMYTTVAFSRIVGIDLSTGKVVFIWPKNDTAYIVLPIIKVHPSGRYIAVASFYGYSPYNPAKWHGGKVWVIDLSTGKVVYTFSPPPMIPAINRTTIWNGLAFTPDGRYLVVVTGDARVFLIDHERSIELGKPVVKWSLTLEKPIRAQVLLIPRGKTEGYRVVSSYIYTFGGLAGIAHGRIIVYTSATYSSAWVPGYLRRPLMQHPNSTKLFIIDLTTGKILYVDRFYGKPIYSKVTPFVVRGCYLVAPIGHDWVRGDASMAGVYVWWICDTPRLIARYLTVQHGLGVPLDVDMHGQYIYVTTGPINLAPSPEQPAKIVGEYRVIALRLTPWGYTLSHTHSTP